MPVPKSYKDPSGSEDLSESGSDGFVPSNQSGQSEDVDDAVGWTVKSKKRKRAPTTPVRSVPSTPPPGTIAPSDIRTPHSSTSSSRPTTSSASSPDMACIKTFPAIRKVRSPLKKKPKSGLGTSMIHSILFEERTPMPPAVAALFP